MSSSTPNLPQNVTPISSPLEKSALESPLSKNPTPRRWLTANVSFKSSGYSPERRVPLTILVRDKRGQLRRETVAFAVGPNRRVALARANQIIEAINGLMAPIVLLTLSSLLGVPL